MNEAWARSLSQEMQLLVTFGGLAVACAVHAGLSQVSRSCLQHLVPIHVQDCSEHPRRGVLLLPRDLQIRKPVLSLKNRPISHAQWPHPVATPAQCQSHLAEPELTCFSCSLE